MIEDYEDNNQERIDLIDDFHVCRHSGFRVKLHRDDPRRYEPYRGSQHPIHSIPNIEMMTEAELRRLYKVRNARQVAQKKSRNYEGRTKFGYSHILECITIGNRPVPKFMTVLGVARIKGLTNDQMEQHARSMHQRNREEHLVSA